jgi:membrane-associated phospholipid phosphatase
MKGILYDWGGLNLWLFRLVNDAHAPWWDKLMLLGTGLGNHTNFTLFLSLAAFIGLLLSVRPGRESARFACPAPIAWIRVLTVFATAYLISGYAIAALKSGFDFPRPLVALPLDGIVVLGEAELKHSFPSGHAEFAMLVSASFWPVLSRPLRIAGAVFVFWVGLSRVSVGAHFPADVVGGWLLALAIVVPLHLAVAGIIRLRLGETPKNAPTRLPSPDD